MLERDEIRRSLTGAFEVFLDRPDAMRHFEVSVASFWRSFAAIVLVAPSYALSALAERDGILADPILAAGHDDALFVLDWALSLGLDWVMLPILLALVAGRLGFARTYPAFVIVRNWAAVLAIAPFGAIALLFMLGFIGKETADIFSLASLFIVLRYNYLVARRALEAPVPLAVAVVVLDLGVSLTIASAVDFIFGM